MNFKMSDRKSEGKETAQNDGLPGRRLEDLTAEERQHLALLVQQRTLALKWRDDAEQSARKAEAGKRIRAQAEALRLQAASIVAAATALEAQADQLERGDEADRLAQAEAKVAHTDDAVSAELLRLGLPHEGDPDWRPIDWVGRAPDDRDLAAGMRDLGVVFPFRARGPRAA